MNNLSCWWKNGKPYPLDDPNNQTHLQYVLDHLNTFGLNSDWINNKIVAHYGEIITEEDGDFTDGADALKENLFYYGWIRVRDFNHRYIVECWNSNSKDLKNCVWWLYQNYKEQTHKDRFNVDIQSVIGKSGAYYESEIDYKYGGHELTELLSSRQIKSEYNPNNFTDSDSFWWRNGTIHNLDEVSTTHDLFVMDNPELFGFEQYKQEVVDEFGDILDENMNPTYDVKKLFDDMFERGWIRVRVWGTEINVECLNSDTKDFKECVWYIYKTFKPRTITIESKVGEYNDDYSEADGTLMELLSSRKTEMKHTLTEKEIINSLILNSDGVTDSLSTDSNDDENTNDNDTPKNISCWWKNGTVVPVSALEFHIDVVDKNPTVFGLTDEYLSDIKENQGNFVVDETETESAWIVMNKLMDDGWYRIRQFDNEIVIGGDETKKSFKDCAWYAYVQSKKNHIDNIVINDDYSEADGTLTELLSSRKHNLQNKRC